LLLSIFLTNLFEICKLVHDIFWIELDVLNDYEPHQFCWTSHFTYVTLDSVMKC